MQDRKKLLFVSTRFLFPADSGGKIRSSQILMGLKGGAFETTLVWPEPAIYPDNTRADIEAVADRVVGWPVAERGPMFNLMRMRHLISRLPIPVKTDESAAASRVIAGELARAPDVVVFDFPHSAVLAPRLIECPSVMFTHNVETEIFSRHVSVAKNPVKRAIWANQRSKMERYERQTLSRFDTVIAVSARDGNHFENHYELNNVELIRTGVNLNFFSYKPPPTDSIEVVFLGAMDWMANIDGIGHFMTDVWPLIAARVPEARMKIVGHSPPASMLRQAETLNWHFTGYVDDVRPHVQEASVFVVPLRVGGGTRIKVFEAMAMGCPVASTTVGVEGLEIEPEQHYLLGDTPEALAEAVVRLLEDKTLRQRISRDARHHVEANFSNEIVAREFEAICLRTVDRTATSNKLKERRRA